MVGARLASFAAEIKSGGPWAGKPPLKRFATTLRGRRDAENIPSLEISQRLGRTSMTSAAVFLRSATTTLEAWEAIFEAADGNPTNRVYRAPHHGRRLRAAPRPAPVTKSTPIVAERFEATSISQTGPPPLRAHKAATPAGGNSGRRLKQKTGKATVPEIIACHANPQADFADRVLASCATSAVAPRNPLRTGSFVFHANEGGAAEQLFNLHTVQTRSPSKPRLEPGRGAAVAFRRRDDDAWATTPEAASGGKSKNPTQQFNFWDCSAGNSIGHFPANFSAPLPHQRNAMRPKALPQFRPQPERPKLCRKITTPTELNRPGPTRSSALARSPAARRCRAGARRPLGQAGRAEACPSATSCCRPGCCTTGRCRQKKSPSSAAFAPSPTERPARHGRGNVGSTERPGYR